MVDKIDKPIKQSIDYDIDMDELIKTTNLNILPDYAKEVIIKDDFLTSRKVIIDSLPVWKDIKGKNWSGRRRIMTIIDNGKRYNAIIDSTSFMRSLIALDIKMNKVIDKYGIDLSRLIGKEVGIHRIQFTNKNGLLNQALNFFIWKE